MEEAVEREKKGERGLSVREERARERERDKVGSHATCRDTKRKDGRGPQSLSFPRVGA
jgi:hypothetical protein